MTAPALTFLAAPSVGGDDDAGSSIPGLRAASRVRSAEFPPTRPRHSAGTLRMTRGAREASTRMKVSDADLRRCLDRPDDVSPDENTPSRTRFRRGTLVVLSGADGMILRVHRGR